MDHKFNFFSLSTAQIYSKAPIHKEQTRKVLLVAITTKSVH